jgi:chorismate-pyruvate lyase
MMANFSMMGRRIWNAVSGCIRDVCAFMASCAAGGVLLWGLAACAHQSPPAGAGVAPGFMARVETLALLQTFNADLLSHDSATLTLERWCGAHRLASPARITAERVSGEDKAPTAQQRLELGVTAAEPIRYRRVRLRCGAIVLSEADNWYVPARLTPDMNAQLDATDAPFGKVVQALHFRRHTLSSTLLWSPLPEGWEMHAAAAAAAGASGAATDAALRLPEYLLEHRAVLVLPDGTPFSEVVESYTGNVLAFPLP